MNETVQTTSTGGWRAWLSVRVAELRQRESQVFLVLALVIGALTGAGGRRLHPADRTHGDAPVSGGRRSVAACAVPGRGFARHRLPAVSLFSECARQRRAADEGCSVRARRPHHAAHRTRQVFLHFSNARQRNSAGTRRAFGASGRGHRFRARTPPRSAHRASSRN